MKTLLPEPTIIRLCSIYQFLAEMEHSGTKSISSEQIAQRLGVESHSVRKDISFLGESGTTRAGYDTKQLRLRIEQRLGLGVRRKACVVGLGRLGSAIINDERFAQNGYAVVAGFDANINKLETLTTNIAVYPSYELSSIVRRENIELGIIAVPAEEARQVADELVRSGIRGIVNFAPVVLSAPGSSVVVRNLDLLNEMRFLSSHIFLSPQPV